MDLNNARTIVSGAFTSNVDVHSSVYEAIQYSGFDMAKWITVNVKKVEDGVKKDTFEFQGRRLEAHDVLAISVNIGLTRGNSTAKKLVDTTVEEDKALIGFVNKITQHKRRVKGDKRKYSATEFTYLRCVSAFPNLASRILHSINLESPEDVLFETHLMPKAFRHGNTYSMSFLCSDITQETKHVLFLACCSVAASVTVRVTPELKQEDFKRKFKDNEEYVTLQKNHLALKGKGNDIKANFLTYKVIQSKSRLAASIKHSAEKYARFMDIYDDFVAEFNSVDTFQD